MRRRIVRSRRSRSFVLIAVLVIVGSALYVATALLFMAQAEAAGAAGSADAAQLRSLAWSGVQAVMSRLAEQRETLLRGGAPSLDPEYVIYETPRVAGVARLISWDGAPGPAARRAAAEAGKLDLNAVDAAQLARTGRFDASAASAVISYRDQTLRRPYQSVAELLDVPGGAVTPSMLLGQAGAARLLDDAQLAGRSIDRRIEDRLDEGNSDALSDLLTVFSVDLPLQRSGAAKINLNAPWSDELGQAVTERFDESVTAQVKTLMTSGVKLDKPSKIVTALLTAKVPVEQWSPVLDAFATDADPERFGLLDINAAPIEALQSLPGVTPEAAARMAGVRRELTDDERAGLAWPVVNQAITPEVFLGLVDRITTRCWTWRVRIAAGEVSVDAPEQPMAARLVYEAVIDLSTPKPRVAYLRDITLLQQTAEIAANVETASAGPAGDGSKNVIEGASEDEPTPGTRAAAATQADGGDEPPAADESVSTSAAPVEGSPPVEPEAASTGTDEAPAASAPASPGPAASSPKAIKRRTGRWIAG